MKKFRLVAILVMMSIMLLNSVSVFAADRDIWNISTMTKFAGKKEMARSKGLRKVVSKNRGKYYFEAGGKLYKMTDVDRLFEQDPENLISNLQAVTPMATVPGGDFLEIVVIE